MNRLCLIGIALFALVFIGIGRAQATHRSDFFNANRLPTVTFDKGSMTWTLRNQAVERVIHFDTKSGRLQTLSFRSLRTRHLLQPGVNAEGEITFVAGLTRPPTPLADWQMTDQTPPADWSQPAYSDTGWTPVKLPYKTDVENKTWWFRCRLPARAMQNNHAYALMFDHAIDDAADIYVDGVLVRKVGAGEQAWNRSLQVDIAPTNKVVAIKLTGGGRPNGLVGAVSLAEVGTAPPSLDLNSDWQYSLQSINGNEDGSKVLTISLLGINKHEGFDLDINYQIFPGEEPTIAKWFTFISHRQNSFLIEQVTYDRWLLPGAHPDTQQYPGTGFAASDPATRDGIFTAVLSMQGSSDRSTDGRQVAPTLRPYYVIKPNVVQQMPRSLTGLYHGPIATGAFLYQLFIGQYIAHATPDSVPVLYNTWFGYLGDINAKICEQIIPMAQDLGVKLFVIDDGWQKNSQPGTGRYGDWIVDRSDNKFPNGLLPISDMVREHRMSFGLWTAPIMVSDQSQAASDYKVWLLQQAGGASVPEWQGTRGMCFASGWANSWGASFALLCRELSVSYLKLDSGLFYDSCVSDNHEHPIGHAATAQAQLWSDFCARLRKQNPDFIIDRGWENGPEVTDMQDEGWFGDWEIGYDTKRQADAAWWYKNADIYRTTLYDLTWTRPSFTIAWETPCHIPTPTPDLNALEYHFTSIGAYICNVELHGKLDQMTPDERALMKKWVKWNTDNRPWLAYTQPLASLGRPTDPRQANAQPHIDGVLHLRNALHGRYGYICLWNPAATAGSAEIAFDPADYYVRLNTGKLEVIRLKDGKPIKYTARPNGIALNTVAMAPRSWEIYELREKGAKER
jgi:hypothetical protein